MSSVSDELQGKPIKLPGLKEIFPALSPPTSQPTQQDSNTLPGPREIFPVLFEDDDDESSQPHQGVGATGTIAPPTTMVPADPTAPQQEEDHLEPLSVARRLLTTGTDPVGNNTTTVPSNSGREHDADKTRPHSVPDHVPGATTEVPSQVGQALQETGDVQQKVDVKGKGKKRARDEEIPENVPHGGSPNGEEVRDGRRQETSEREQEQQNGLEEDEEQRQHEEDEKLKHGNEYEVYVRTLNERKNVKEKAEAEAREDRLREMEKAGTLPWQQEKHQTGFEGLPTAGRASHRRDGPSNYRGSLPPLGPHGGYNAAQNRWNKGKHRRGKLPGIKTQAPFQNPFRDKSKTTWNQNFPDGRVPNLGKWGMPSAKPVMKVVPDEALDPAQSDNDATPGPSAAPGSRTTNNGRATSEPNHRIKKPRTAPAAAPVAQPTIVDQLPVGPPRMARPQDATTEQLRQHARELRATINEMLIIYDRIGERMESNREAGQTKNEAESKQRRSIMGKVSTLEKRNEIIRVTLEARGEQMPN